MPRQSQRNRCLKSRNKKGNFVQLIKRMEARLGPLLLSRIQEQTGTRMPPSSAEEEVEVVANVEEQDWANDWLEIRNDVLPTIQNVLSFNEGAGTYLRAPYGSGSRRTFFRQQQRRRELSFAAQSRGQTTLAAFLNRPKPTEPVRPPLSVPATILCGFDAGRLNIVIESLNTLLRDSCSELGPKDVLKIAAVRQYFSEVLDGRKLMAASEQAVKILGIQGREQTGCKMVRAWGRRYYEDLSFPVEKRGRHQKTMSLIDDEDVRRRCLEYLRAQHSDKLTTRGFFNFVNTELLPEVTGSPNTTICLRTAQNWMHVLNFEFGEETKGAYVDGHERPDVQEYRTKFLARMEGWLPFMATFDEDESGRMQMTLPILPPGCRRHVFVVHDESIFTAYDSNRFVWVEKGKNVLRKKGQGKSLMVSDFLCECHGPLYRLASDGSKILCRRIITPGSGASDDGWWKSEDLLKQLEKDVLPAFEDLHPDCAGIFAFDNSMNHKKMPSDGLDVSHINLSDGGKNARSIIRDGWFSLDNGVVSQPMLTSEGVQKGIRTILEERGLWVDSMRLDDARAVLSQQPDFQAQKSLLEETIDRRADVSSLPHQFILFPKFHCELSHIELYWGQAKRFARQNCDYTFSGLKRMVPRALDSVSVDTIRRNARYCFRYMDAYRRGLPAKLAAYAVKKYKSHRRIPEDVDWEALENDAKDATL